MPFLLRDSRDYAVSLARSRIVGEAEGAISPLLAASLLLVLSTRGVFIVAMGGFLVSALLIAAARLPEPDAPDSGPLYRVATGFRALVADPALRGLLPLHVAAAAIGAMVMVNTVLFVRGRFALDAEATAVALAVFGLGAVAGALWVAKALPRLDPRRLMLAGGLVVTAVLAAGVLASLYPTLLVLWALGGFGAALAQVPAADLIRRTVAPDAYQTVYAANFAATTLTAGLGYAAGGWLGASLTLNGAFAVLAGLSGAAVALGWWLWAPGLRRPATGRGAGA